MWIMRQAGRYLPEFRELRKQYSFREVCENKSLAAEVTLQPYRRFPQLDACIVFSDILTVLDSMGQTVDFADGGPQITPRLTDPEVARAHLLSGNYKPNVAASEAIRECVARLQGAVPVIGFAGAPFTLFSYAVEGGGSKTWGDTRRWLYQWKHEAHEVIRAISEQVLTLLVRQVDAGAPVVQIFETNGGIVCDTHYREFALPYLLDVASRLKALRPDVKVIAFPKDVSLATMSEFDTACVDAVSVSWTAEVQDVAAKLPRSVLQGNLDPAILMCDDATIRSKTLSMLRTAPQGRLIANLGHGILPGTSLSSVEAFLRAVKTRLNE